MKSAKKKALDLEIRNCKKCPGLNATNQTETAVAFGDLNARIMLVGQSLCTACMNTGIPFTRGSGYLLDAVLKLLGLQRKDVLITNVIHCHPPHNRKSEKHEIRRCLPYLQQEINIVQPQLIVTLGADARESFTKIKTKAKIHSVKHPAYFLHKGFEGAVDWMVNLATKMEKYK
jgi:DNA polymerase